MPFSEVVDMIRTRVAERSDPEKIKDLNAVFQFALTGDNGGTFHTRVAGGEVEIVESAHDSPNVTIIMSLEDFTKMTEGQLNATSAFMAGKLKVKGDMSLAMKLQSLIS